MLSKLQKRVVSSAYIINPKTSVKLGKSCMYIDNNKGHRRGPYGTPDFTINEGDRILSYSTIVFCLLTSYE